MGNHSRKQCFFITPIGAEDSPERERSNELLHVLRPVLDGLGFDLTRGDEDPVPGQIVPQVLDSIATADVVIADVSGSNPNVYYELAVAHAARRPTVIIQEGTENLPFDIADMRAIPYDLTRPTRTTAMTTAVRRAIEAVEGGIQPRNPLRDLTFGELEANEVEAVRARPEAAALADLTEEVRAIGSEMKRLSDETARSERAHTSAAKPTTESGDFSWIFTQAEALQYPLLDADTVTAMEKVLIAAPDETRNKMLDRLNQRTLEQLARMTGSRDLFKSVSEKLRNDHHAVVFRAQPFADQQKDASD